MFFLSDEDVHDFIVYVLEDIFIIRVSNYCESLLFIKRFFKFSSVLRQTQKEK